MSRNLPRLGPYSGIERGLATWHFSMQPYPSATRGAAPALRWGSGHALSRTPW